MATPLNLFPQRAAIGRADARGDVYMTDAFTRALAALLVRVGGTNGNDMGEIALELATQGNAAAWGASRGLAALEQELAQAVQLTARLAELRKHVAALEAQLVQVAPPTDWEHPGKVGAATANSGKFTTLEATDKVKLNPAAKDVEIKPTGAALVTIQPQNVGQIDNMELGKTAPADARVRTLNKMTFTQPATGATWTIGDGKMFTVGNTLSLTGTDGAALNIGNGGALGTAAFANASAFAARSGTALGGPATDAASTQALANTLRSVLLGVGIGS